MGSSSRTARRRTPAGWVWVVGVLTAWVTVVGSGAGPAVGAPVSPSPGAPATRSASASPRHGWSWPLRPDPTVVRRFEAPPQPWAPGHRGVDLAAATGQVVHAPAAGRVTFAGVVVDRGVLTLQHAGGLRTSYEPVKASVVVGDVVAAGQPVADVSEVPGHCAPASCLHWGARRGTVYVDPLGLLRPPDPPVLLPLLRSGRWSVPA